MKKASIIVICVLIAFIPTYIALGAYFTSQKVPVTESTVESLILSAPNGESFSYSKTDGEDFIAFVLEMNKNSERQLALPEPLLDDPYYLFTFYSFDKATEYKYYFSKQPSDAYYTDADGAAFKISADYALEFLKLPAARSVYSDSSAPSLLINSSELLPSSMSWEYRGAENAFYPGLVSTENGNETSVESYGAPVLSFSLEPDTVSIKLTSGAETLFDDYYYNLANYDFSGKALEAVINAKWYESDDRTYRGEASYKVSLDFLTPPVFYLSSPSAQNGSLVTVSVSDAVDPSLIRLSFEPSLSIEPKFYKVGNAAYALLPISPEIKPGSYTVRASYNGQSESSFTLDVSGAYTAEYPYNVEKTLFDDIYTEANVTAHKELLASFFEQTSNEPLFSGTFISGMPRGTFESADYGDRLTISENSVMFRNPGVYYSCTRVSDVTAVNSGVVIYAGSDKLAGNIVALDHGMGLVSVYAHLGEISVKVGDKLERGDKLGVSGRTGLISKKSAATTLARVEVYLHGVPVDVDLLIKKAIELKFSEQ